MLPFRLSTCLGLLPGKVEYKSNIRVQRQKSQYDKRGDMRCITPAAMHVVISPDCGVEPVSDTAPTLKPRWWTLSLSLSHNLLVFLY